MICETAQDPKPEVLVTVKGHGMALMHWVAPEQYDRMINRKSQRDHFQDKKAEDTQGNLYEASDYAAVHGGWKGSGKGKAAGIAAAGGVAGLVIYLLKRKAEQPGEEQPAA